MLLLNDLDSLTQDSSGIITDKFLTVKIASKLTGYNNQYIRRLLRNGKLDGIQVGQTWLIRLDSLEKYLAAQRSGSDHRYGPKRQTPNDENMNKRDYLSTNVNSVCLRLFTDQDFGHS